MRQILLFFTLLMLLFISCGRDENDEGKGVSSQTPMAELEAPIKRDGEYRAVLTGVNKLDASGVASIKLQEQNVELKFNLVGNDRSSTLIQKVVAINECPNLVDDANADGVVDVGESVLRKGELLANFTESMQEELTAHGQVLDNKYLVVFGVSSRVTVPATVEVFEGESARASLPLACGKIIYVPNEK